MKSFAKSLFILSIFFVPLFQSCSDESSNDPGGEDVNKQIEKGILNLRITDAPIDDARVMSAFMTFSGVKLDTQTILFDNKVTLDMLALQDGETTTLFNDSIKVGQYSTLELLVDYDIDASGNQPGCYVLDDMNVKHDLKTENQDNISISLNQVESEIKKGLNSQLTIDMDLRKAIQYELNPIDDDKYTFNTDLNSTIRIVDTNHFTIDGSIQDILDISGDKTIVYVYRKGAFDTDMEVDNNSQFQFKNAITSTMVDENGKFEIHFLQQDDYELRIISFNTMDDGSLEAKGIVEVTALTEIDPLGVLLDSNLEINMTAVAVTPF